MEATEIHSQEKQNRRKPPLRSSGGKRRSSGAGNGSPGLGTQTRSPSRRGEPGPDGRPPSPPSSAGVTPRGARRTGTRREVQGLSRERKGGHSLPRAAEETRRGPARSRGRKREPRNPSRARRAWRSLEKKDGSVAKRRALGPPPARVARRRRGRGAGGGVALRADANCI